MEEKTCKDCGKRTTKGHESWNGRSFRCHSCHQKWLAS